MKRNSAHSLVGAVDSKRASALAHIRRRRSVRKVASVPNRPVFKDGRYPQTLRRTDFDGDFCVVVQIAGGEVSVKADSSKLTEPIKFGDCKKGGLRELEDAGLGGENDHLLI